MKVSALLLAVFGLLPHFASATESSDVIDLTAANFDSVVKAEDLILVEFFAPWCGHCKALAPHYEEAATTLKGKNIKIAKVDCVDQADLCNDHGVTGYPTLKIFRNGTPSDYSGPRKADGIVSYMVKQSLPAVSEVTITNHDEFLKADKVVVVAYLSSTTSSPAPVFSQVAEKHRDDYLFGLSTDAEAIKAAGVSTPAVVVYMQFDEGRKDFSGDVESVTDVELEAFIKENSIPLFDEISAETYATYAQLNIPIAYVFVDPTDGTKDELIKSLTPVAAKHKGKLSFVWIDAIKFVEHAKSLVLPEPKWPSFVIQDLTNQLKYPLDQSIATDAKNVGSFVDDYVAGKLEPKMKSEAVPETQDEPVYVLVGSEFERVVYDDSKDVFIEFYAPWCGHCKRLKPTWDTLGERYSSVKDLITIAKMDATENDLPADVPFRISGFPTIKFKPAGTREFLDYEGDRSLDSLIEFVEQKAKNSLVIPEPSAASDAPEPVASESVTADHDEL